MIISVTIRAPTVNILVASAGRYWLVKSYLACIAVCSQWLRKMERRQSCTLKNTHKAQGISKAFWQSCQVGDGGDDGDGDGDGGGDGDGISICKYVCMCMHMGTCMYACVNLNMHMYICIYVHIYM